MNLHNEIMDIQVSRLEEMAAFKGFTNGILIYRAGHRDALHAAAGLALKHDALIEALSDHFGSGIVDMFKRKVGL